MVPGAGAGGQGVKGAVSSVGEGLVRGSGSGRRPGGVNFHGGSYFEVSEAEGGVGGTQKEENLCKEEESEALWGEEAWGLRNYHQ
jgi:hypothetical protein